MVLHSWSPSKHNAMCGKKLPPGAVKVENEDFFLPVAKRRKTSDSRAVNNSQSSDDDNSNEITLQRETQFHAPIEDEEDNVPPSSAPTELESALPPVRTDKAAILEYEASRTVEPADIKNAEEDLDLEVDPGPRLNSRKWERGKSSIYVDAFNLALNTVLVDESHLFTPAELAVFDAWKASSYEEQYLYVRLFLRKSAAWHRIEKLGYHGDIANMQQAVDGLLEKRPLPPSDAEDYFQAEPDEKPLAQLKDMYAFADDSAEHITTLEEASSLLHLDEVKALAKDARVQGKNKKDLLRALHRQSSTQGGLGNRTIKRSDTEESAHSDMSPAPDRNWDAEDMKSKRNELFLRKILANTGQCIRLSETIRKLFERVHLVFYRSTEWSEKSLTTIILARISRRNFPEYIVCRSANIFPSRSLLLEFEAAIRTQFAIDSLLEFNGPVTTADHERILRIFEEVYPRWSKLLAEELEKEIRIYETGEGAYLRRFSPAWVYTRIVHKALGSMAKFKEHKREHIILTTLLEQQLFHPSRRGDWYQRKALIEEHYMWALEPTEGRTSELQKKHWRRIALQTCDHGLQDRNCHIKYHYDLQKRITKLEKALKIPKRQQHDFEHVRYAKLVERDVEGIRVERDKSATPAGRRGGEGALTFKGTKTIWIDEREGGVECSVEEMCLSWYRGEGWKGYHCEGGLVRTLFGYLFFDILFTFLPNVFQTEYQTCPLDLHSDAFYAARISLINQRLAAISNGEAKNILAGVYKREHEKQTCVVGLNWEYDHDDLIEILDCFPGSALATVCQVMAQEYANRGGGVPDLFLWHPQNREIMFSEVKSENDRLSDTQRLWMHVLTGAGIRVELCHAVARDVRIDGNS